MKMIPIIILLLLLCNLFMKNSNFAAKINEKVFGGLGFNKKRICIPLEEVKKCSMYKSNSNSYIFHFNISSVM